LTARLDTCLDALLAAGLLWECTALPGDVLQFDHQLLREVVLADQEGPRAERARHRHLATSKVRRVERGDRTLLPEVAHHFMEARDWTNAVRYHKLAGDAARDTLAFREAASLYEAAIRLLTEQPGSELRAEEKAALFEMQAETLTDLGRMDEALKAHRSAQQEARAAPAGEAWSPILWGRNERGIAFLLCLQGRLDEAALVCDRAREVLETADAEIDLADALRTLGLIETYRGRHETAMAHLKRSLAIYERGQHREGLARCYGTLAHLYHGQSDLSAMLEAAKQSQAIWQELDRPVSLGRALNNAAVVFSLLGRDEEALPLLFRAVEIFERHHVEKDLPNVYHSLAEALLKCGRADEARPYLERGLEIARRVGEVRTVADFHRLHARRAIASGQAAEARIEFEAALRVCEVTDLEPLQAQIYLEFGIFLQQTNEPAEALRLLEVGLVIRRRLGSEGVAEAEAAVARARAELQLR
jgi:tetratricopeptide (TPR) repeat protein